MIAVAACVACGVEPIALPDLPAAKSALPDPEPLAGWRRAAIDLTLTGRVWTGARSGYVALVAREGRLVHASTVGYADVEAATPMRMDMRFRMASMTKPVTAVAAMILVEEGKLGLDDPVSKYLPEVAEMRVAIPPRTDQPAENEASDAEIETIAQSTPMTIRHLLSFSSGIGGAAKDASPLTRSWKAFGDRRDVASLRERVEGLVKLPLYEQPGTKWRYGYALDVLARVIEVVSGESLNVWMERRIFTPLGMHATRYPMDMPADAPVATLYTQDAEGDLVPADGPRFRAAEWTPGGSGLVSTAPDYMRFALMLWNGGEYAGVRILEEATVAEMTRLQVESGVLEDYGIEGLGFGLGLSVVADEDLTIMPGTNGDFWWSGLYGTHFWVSPSTGIVVVVVQQNRPSEYSSQPVAPIAVQTIALGG